MEDDAERLDEREMRFSVAAPDSVRKWLERVEADAG
jgi:hypothetical protein